MSSNEKYYRGLSSKQKKEKKENIKKTKKLIEKGKDRQAFKLASKRPTIKKTKTSPYTEQFKKLYPNTKPLTTKFATMTGVPLKAQKEIFKRGKGAFATAGSRSSVKNPETWAYARLYAFVIKLKKKKLDFDKDLVKKYKIKIK